MRGVCEVNKGLRRLLTPYDPGPGPEGQKAGCVCVCLEHRTGLAHQASALRAPGGECFDPTNKVGFISGEHRHPGAGHLLCIGPAVPCYRRVRHYG